MFFRKSEKNISEPTANITIIGTSAAGLYLADILQNNNCRVAILIPPHQEPLFSRIGAFNIKTPSFQNRHANYSFTSSLQTKPNFCFVASSAETAKTDLLLLNNSLLKGVPIINLSLAYNRREIKQLNDITEFSAWFDNLFNLEKTTLSSLDRSLKLEICCPNNLAAAIKNLFPENSISITSSADSTALFWKYFAPFCLTNLLISAHGRGIRSHLSNPEIRQQLDKAIDEIVLFAKTQNISLNGSDILAKIYTFPDNWQGDISSKSGFIALSDNLKNISPFETPALFSLSSQAVDKLLA